MAVFLFAAGSSYAFASRSGGRKRRCGKRFHALHAFSMRAYAFSRQWLWKKVTEFFRDGR